jgi:hypothetical protein
MSLVKIKLKSAKNKSIAQETQSPQAGVLTPGNIFISSERITIFTSKVNALTRKKLGLRAITASAGLMEALANPNAQTTNNVPPKVATDTSGRLVMSRNKIMALSKALIKKPQIR